MGRFFSRMPRCTFEDCALPCHGPNKKHPRRLFLFREEAAGVLLFCVIFCVLGLVEHILQAFEEALALFVVVLFQGALKLLQCITLDLGELFGDLHLALDVHIAPAAAVQVLDALAPQTEGCLLYTSPSPRD